MSDVFQEPEIGSLWADTDSGYLYQYRGIDQSGTFKERLSFGSYDCKTKTASQGGGLWIGTERFKTDMVPVGTLAAHPCCGAPTYYPTVWCDDCGYETWDKARDEKEKTA